MENNQQEVLNGLIHSIEDLKQQLQALEERVAAFAATPVPEAAEAPAPGPVPAPVAAEPDDDPMDWSDVDDLPDVIIETPLMQPSRQPEPEPAQVPEPALETEPALEPKPESTPEPVPEPKPEPIPEPAPEQEPAPTPEPEQIPEQVRNDEGESRDDKAESADVAESSDEAEAPDMQEQQPEPAAEFASELAPEPAAELAPEPAPELAPEPAAEPSAEPAPTAVKGKSLADLAAERLAWKTDFPGISVKNIRSAISLVDRAQFIAKLFGEDFALYDKTISELNDLTTLDEAVQYVTGHFPDWNLSSDLVYSFMMAIRKKLG